MKKILALILAVCMVLGTMVFSVSAATPADRAINIEVDYDEVFAEEEIVLSVVLDGEDMANAEWTITYEPSKFQLLGSTDMVGNFNAMTDTTGVIDDFDFLRDGSVYADGAVLRTYKFKAIAQVEREEAEFGIENTAAYTYIESINGTDVVTDNNDSLTVVIKLIDYILDVQVDGVSTTETSWNKPYDNEEHTFKVITDPPATVTYTVNGSVVSGDEIVIDAEGTYVIQYTVTAATGYAPITKTFTMEIEAPEYEIEVVDDYVDGKALILVYTRTDGVYFTYDGNPMVDVTVAGYEFEGSSYEHVFGFVTDGLDASGVRIPEATLKAPVDHEYTVDYSEVEKVDEYNHDLNLNGEVELRDVTSAFGIYNVNTEYFTGTTYMKKILRADIVRDKHVNGSDTGAVYNAFLYD